MCSFRIDDHSDSYTVEDFTRLKIVGDHSLNQTDDTTLNIYVAGLSFAEAFYRPSRITQTGYNFHLRQELPAVREGLYLTVGSCCGGRGIMGERSSGKVYMRGDYWGRTTPVGVT